MFPYKNGISVDNDVCKWVNFAYDYRWQTDMEIVFINLKKAGFFMF